MKTRNLSMLLALVMILSAFAGTFTISAEEAPGVFEVDGKFYNDFTSACEATPPGGTLLVHKDYTIPKGNDADPYYWLYDAVIEGVQKPDGSYPTLKTHMRYHRIYCMGECTWRNLNFLFNDVIQSSVFLVSNVGKDGSVYSEESKMVMENVNMILHSTSKSDAEIPGSVFRLYHSNTSAHLKNCTVTVPSTYSNPFGKASGVFMIFKGVENATLTLENTTVDASEAGSGICVLYSQNPNNKLIIRNSTLNSGPDSPISDPYDLDVEYVGTNRINGQLIATEDMLGDEVADRKARKEGYVARIGAGKDAIGEDGSFPGYYKSVAEAVAAAAAMLGSNTEEGEVPQPEVVLIADTAEQNVLTLPGILFNGNGRTLTAPGFLKSADGDLTVKDLNLVSAADGPMLEVTSATGAITIDKSTFTSTGAAPVAYVVSNADMTVKKSSFAVTHETCDKSIFSISGGADLMLTDVTIDTVESAPALSLVEVLSEEGSTVLLEKKTSIKVGKNGLASTSKGANVFSVLGDSILSAEGDAISLPAEAGAWTLSVNGKAQVTSVRNTAILASSAGTTVTVGGTAIVTGARDAINAAGEGVRVEVESGATVALTQYSTNNAAVNLTGKNVALDTKGTISATKRGGAVKALGENASVIIRSGKLSGEMTVGSAGKAATLIFMAGELAVTDGETVPAITVANGAAYLLSGKISGGTMAVDAETDTVYPEGTTELVFNDFYENAPIMGEVTMRMNEDSLGMRFSSMISADIIAYAELLKSIGLVQDYEFGTLIARSTALRNVDMTVADMTEAGIIYAQVKAAAGIVEAEDGSKTYTAAVINFSDDHLGYSLTARAYIKYTLTTGDILYVYAEDRTEAVSMGELAQQCLADVVDESTEGYRNQVQEFYEADEDGWYELVQDTAYSPYSKEQQAALKQIVENADL